MTTCDDNQSDEIDSLLQSRGHGGSSVFRSVQTVLMTEWDGLASGNERIIVLGATNRPYARACCHTPHASTRDGRKSLPVCCVVLCCVVLCFIYWSGRGEVSRFDLDEAILRRMPRRLLVDVPDAKGRKMILEKLLQTVR